MSYFILRPYRFVYEFTLIGTALYWYGWFAALLVVLATVDFVRATSGDSDD